jgi:hypothetical protein
MFFAREHELIFSGNRRGGPEDWSWQPPRAVLRYEGVSNFDDYLDRTLDEFRLTDRGPVRAIESPLELVAARDYLDMVWRVVHPGSRLPHLPGAERTAKLAADASTPDEFSSRLSALAETLKGFCVEGTGHPVRRLKQHMTTILDAGSLARLEPEFGALEDISMLRIWHQHGQTPEDVVRAFRRLGLEFPVFDYGTGWNMVRLRAVGALEALREELQTLVTP